MRNFNRNENGVSLALVAVCAGALVIFIVICFQLMMAFGAIQELNGTADAAALNIAKRSMDVKTAATPSYNDCTDSQGTIGLANINRVWGKAYLINANVEEMTANQQVTDLATAAADKAFADAQYINNNLSALLKNNLTLNSFFDQIAGLRLHRMLGNASVSSDTNTNWSTSLAYRGDQSNLAANFSQVPSPTNSHCNVIPAGNGSTYMPGYSPMEANNKSFCFVAFHNAERPHLITESFFQKNTSEKSALANIANPLPNAFSGYGTTQNSMSSHSFAAANPQRQYNLAVPHAFATISLVNLAYWFVQGKQINMTTYGFAQETQYGAEHIPLIPAQMAKVPPKDFLDGWASLGNEFNNPNLLDVIMSVDPDPNKVLANLTQRMQEIKSDFTMNDLEQLLQQQKALPGVNNYVVYPGYIMPDNTYPTIKLAPMNTQGIASLPKWLASSAANDGMAKAVANKDPVQDDPNYDWEKVSGFNFQAGPHWTVISGSASWTPGSGYNQTLGRLTIVHTTRCYFTAVPI